jgi:beta-ketoacyl-acyl-carrier-protein synthase II
MRRVVVTGMGLITPIGIGKEKCWESILKGRSGTRYVKEFANLKLKSRVAGFVDDFAPSDYGLSPAEMRRMERVTQFGVAAAEMALKDSGLSLDEVDRDRVGVNIATAVAGTKFMDEEFLVVTNNGTRPVNPDDVSPYAYTKSMPNTTSNEIAARFGLRGISTTSATGCTGGIDAIGFACNYILTGDAEVMLAGATEAPITPVTIGAFDAIGAISWQNHRPQAASRPFDKERDAFVLAEGAGILVLEELEHARRRGARIYGELCGYASVSNSFHMTGLGGPAKDHMSRVLRMTLAKAEVEPKEVDYINAHGSGTIQNDICETESFKMVFGSEMKRIPVSSIKSMIGHPLAAASAIEICICFLCMERSFIPPTINLDNPDPDCDLDYVPKHGREKEINVIVKDASGFSGVHSAIVLKKIKYEVRRP